MRLINADAYLDKVCTYKTTGCGSCEFLTICPVDEPTIEAIPIEWIKKQVKDGWYDIIEIMYHWEIENNIKESILWGTENE